MIALDTNILVRYVTQDDSHQLPSVMRLLNRRGETFFIGQLVMLELHWALQHHYDWSRSEIAHSLAQLLTIQNASFEEEEVLNDAISAYNHGEDLADWLIHHRAVRHGCQSLASFDRDLQKTYPRFVFQPR